MMIEYQIWDSKNKILIRSNNKKTAIAKALKLSTRFPRRNYKIMKVTN